VQIRPNNPIYSTAVSGFPENRGGIFFYTANTSALLLDIRHNWHGSNKLFICSGGKLQDEKATDYTRDVSQVVGRGMGGNSEDATKRP